MTQKHGSASSREGVMRGLRGIVFGVANNRSIAWGIARAVRAAGSPGYPADEEEVAAAAGRAYDRSYDPAGVARQAVATVASGDRTERLRHLELPTLVIHGLADGMCDASGGRATAEAIPGAELVLIEGMGHDLPAGLRSQLAERIAGFVWRAEGR